MKPFLAALKQGQVLLLDGATGTELERRGFITRLPLWTATAAIDNPRLLYQVHESYVAVGADIITANTFRTNRYSLRKASHTLDADALTRETVAIAKAAASLSCWVAGSLAPLEDCYFPERTPDSVVLEVEHAHHAQCLAKHGVDLILVETMPTAREAVVAAKAALATGLPVVVSMLIADHCTLYDGTPLDVALAQLVSLPLAMLSLNCGPPAFITKAVPSLRATDIAFGAYGNTGTPDASFGSSPAELTPEDYASHAATWLASGAQLLGGCCGTRPEHIAKLRSLLDC